MKKILEQMMNGENINPSSNFVDPMSEPQIPKAKGMMFKSVSIKVRN